MTLPWYLARGRRAGDHDLGLSVFLLVYGTATLVNPNAWLEQTVYDFLDGADLRAVSIGIIVLGLAQAAGAFVNLRYWRRAVAVLGVLQWASFAWGGWQHDPNAYVPMMYGCTAVGNAIVAWRV